GPGRTLVLPQKVFSLCYQAAPFQPHRPDGPIEVGDELPGVVSSADLVPGLKAASDWHIRQADALLAASKVLPRRDAMHGALRDRAETHREYANAIRVLGLQRMGKPE